MASGKTTAGRKISELSGMKFIDIDELFEGRFNMTISSYFKEFGETSFREEEKKLIFQVASEENLVISTGGGAMVYLENRKALKKNGIIFYLEILPETVYERVKGDISRPMLNSPNPKEKIYELFKKRVKFYKMADYTVLSESKTPEVIAKEILTFFQRRGLQ